MYCVDGTNVKFDLGLNDVDLYKLRRELPSPRRVPPSACCLPLLAAAACRVLPSPSLIRTRHPRPHIASQPEHPPRRERHRPTEPQPHSLPTDH